MNQEQKTAKQVILSNAVTLIQGKAGSGKTLLACQTALTEFTSRRVDKIVIIRPAVEAGESLGFLPGDISDKMEPWVKPIYDNFVGLAGKEKVDKMMKAGEIDIQPVGLMRGITLTNAFIIVDECQNMKISQVEMALGRLGKGSRMVFCGDLRQTDLKRSIPSGILIFDHLEKDPEVSRVTLLEGHRHPVVDRLLDLCQDFTQQKSK